MNRVTWVLESEVFPESHAPLREAIVAARCEIVDWQDEWWATGEWPSLSKGAVVFHGSLGNAALVAQRLSWAPGAWCDTPRFHCSAWYEQARPWLLHRDWRILPAEELVASAKAVGLDLGSEDRVFVRPDSPLKPFSGRVLDTDTITLAALDHGFYYEDPCIPVVVAPVRDVQREWRFVVVRSEVVAGSAYDPATRSASTDSTSSEAWRFASSVATELTAPEDIYILDVCEADGQFRLLELNPFSGADLYACSAADLVSAVSEVAQNATE